jgi:hypothetical protein
MPTFAENLETLESVEGLSLLELGDESGAHVAIIENKPGSAGSFRVYCHVAKKWGGIGSDAAREALDLFAEHTGDARLNPGKHPNIDRLFKVIAENRHYTVRCLPAK